MKTGSLPGMPAMFAVLLSIASVSVAGTGEVAGAADPASARCQVLRADEAWRGTGVTVDPSRFVCVVAHGATGVVDV